MAQRFQSSQNNDLSYLPNSLMLSSVPENDMIGMTKTSGSSSYDDDEYLGGKSSKVKKSRSDDTSLESGSNSPNSSGDFYLYRQPQLNRTMWEVKPRIGNW